MSGVDRVEMGSRRDDVWLWRLVRRERMIQLGGAKAMTDDAGRHRRG
jgi:hypothetical protein